jgi:STE24 endopeptidase
VNEEATREYSFNKSAQEKAKKYQRVKLLTSLFEYTLFLIGGLLILQLGVSMGLRSFVLTYVSEPLSIILYSSIGFFVLWLVSLPFDYYKGYVIEHQFGLSTQTLRSWSLDRMKELILGISIVVLIVQGIYFTLNKFPTYWWLITWAFISLVMLALTYIGPIVIMPLFFKFPPLKDAQLIERLTNLAKKAGIRVVGVFEMKAGVKTKKALGALAGVGNTRRIILSDTLLSNCTHDEIEVVIGHELGHHIFHHIGKMIAMSSVVMLMAFYVGDLILKVGVRHFGFSGIDDIASLPLLAITLGLIFMLATPFLKTVSRCNEGQADQYALETVNKPDAFISCMVKLCDQNLRYADPHPLIEFLFYDHPSGKKRVQRALNYKRSHALGCCVGLR